MNLESLKDLLNDMSSTTKAIVIIAAICGVLGYAYITKETPAEEPAGINITTGAKTNTSNGAGNQTANGDTINISK